MMTGTMKPLLPVLAMANDDRRAPARTRAGLRVAVGRGGWTNDDWDALTTQAKYQYGQDRHLGGPMGRVGAVLLGVYGLAILAAHAFFRWEERRWNE